MDKPKRFHIHIWTLNMWGLWISRFPKSWGYPQIIQVMNDHDLDILKPMVTWGYLHFRKPPHSEAPWIAKLTQIT
jgi:hypothetical protein